MGAEEPPWQRHPLTNAGVLTLARAGYSEEFLLEQIQRGPVRFDVTVEALANLAESGLSERLVRAMIEAEAARLKGAPPAIRPTQQAVPILVVEGGLWKKRIHWLSAPLPSAAPGR